jgi:CRISPR-associated endonuclease/helicase Cas3
MLTSQDFTSFFTALHGHAPFAWQSRLAAEVATIGWPDQIAAPTGCGKTSSLDVAVFELARQATCAARRIAALRIFSIIDRRIVVDSTFQHARAIAKKLQAAENGILRAVADALRSISGEDVPLVVARLRGGTWQDDSWINSPIQPAVIVSTVDQVGSRLLFRGYGVARGQRPLHAALVGNDSLFLVDEAHLSRPFVNTTQAVRTLASLADTATAMPPTIVEMTATPAATSGRRFDLDAADYDHPVLKPRLTCSKMARLVRVTVAKDDTEIQKRAKLSEAAAREAIVLAGLAKAVKKQRLLWSPAAVVGIVVNRVATAREIFSVLSQRIDCDSLLLTGRVRPLERDQLLRDWMPKIRAGRDETVARPLFVVATQCIEVGADLDFDALVTEVAPLDALRQRFGRLDRLGRRGQSAAVIIARSDTVSTQADDPVYGAAMMETWKWLQEIGGKDQQVDFGIAALPMPSAKDQQRLLVSPGTAPRIRSQDVDALACTSVQLAHEPDLPLYLHGQRDNPDVSVVWRADLPDPLNSANAWDAVDIVTMLPPTASEALALPVYLARGWLRGIPRDVADVEGERRPTTEQQGRSRVALRWRGDDSNLITADDVQPGDVIIVPASYGGCDQFGWNPESRKPVTDIADQCAWLTRWKPVLRLSRNQVPADALDEDNPQAISPGVLDAVLATLPACPEPLRSRRNRLPPVPYPEGAGWLIEAKQRIAPPAEDSPPVEAATALLGREVELGKHCGGVAERAVRMAKQAHLPDDLTRAVEIAARLHDVGKVDPRFQVWLHRGDEVAAVRRVLAKSGINPRNRHLYEAARKASGLPAGWRHELLSVRLAEAVCADPLALHLIAAHHGGGRPFHMPVLDLTPPAIAANEWTLALGAAERTPDKVAELCDRVADRFESLQRKYGWWGLALLESFLLLADWQQSADEKSTRQETEQART